MFGLRKILGDEKSGSIKKKWGVDTKSTLVAPPTICDLENNGQKHIVFGTKQGKIYSLDRQSNIKWTFDAKEQVDDVELMFLDVDSANSIESTPHVFDLNGDGKKEILFGCETGMVYALSHDGKLMWNFKTGDAVRGGIIVKDVNGDGKPEVIFGSSDKNVYVLNAKGQLMYKIDVGEEIESTPEVYKGMIIFGTRNGNVKCFNLEGREIWNYKTKDKVIAQPVIGKIHGDEQDFVIIGSQDHNMYAFTMNGELEWEFKTGGAIYSKAALADINNDRKLEIVFGSCDNKIYAIDSYGEEIWTYETDFWIVAPVIITDIDNDGKLEIIAGSYDHNLYVLDARGNYLLNYVPGLSGIMQQTGSYSDITTSEAGAIVGKKIWQYQTEGVIVGCAIIDDDKEIIISTEKGEVDTLSYEKRG